MNASYMKIKTQDNHFIITRQFRILNTTVWRPKASSKRAMFILEYNTYYLQLKISEREVGWGGRLETIWKDHVDSRNDVGLHGVLLSPFSGELVVSISISLVDSGDFRDERIIRVGVAKKRADRKQNWKKGKWNAEKKIQNQRT